MGVPAVTSSLSGEVAMLSKEQYSHNSGSHNRGSQDLGLHDRCSNGLASAVAIRDKEIRTTDSFRIEIFELCSLCGARFGIGYFGASRDGARPAEEIEELPRKLIEILARDHWHSRQHKGLIELNY
jgi:hypothetical protein